MKFKEGDEVETVKDNGKYKCKIIGRNPNIKSCVYYYIDSISHPELCICSEREDNLRFIGSPKTVLDQMIEKKNQIEKNLQEVINVNDGHREQIQNHECQIENLRRSIEAMLEIFAVLGTTALFALCIALAQAYPIVFVYLFGVACVATFVGYPAVVIIRGLIAKSRLKKM